MVRRTCTCVMQLLWSCASKGTWTLPVQYSGCDLPVNRSRSPHGSVCLASTAPAKPCTLCYAVRCRVHIPDLHTMRRARRRGASAAVDVQKVQQNSSVTTASLECDKCNHRVCAVCLPESVANPHMISLASHTQTLLDMPTEVLATICSLCDVSTKMVRSGSSVLHVI